MTVSPGEKREGKGGWRWGRRRRSSSQGKGEYGCLKRKARNKKGIFIFIRENVCEIRCLTKGIFLMAQQQVLLNDLIF